MIGPGVVSAAEAAPAPVLPSARQLIGAGLDLALRTSSDLRAGSLAIGLQLLATLGPFVVLIVVVLGRAPDLLDLLADATPGATPDPRAAAIAGPLALSLIVGVLALVALFTEGGIIAIALLAGRLIGRPVSLREALRRSRQVFWRVLAVSIVVQVVATIATSVFDAVAGPILGPSEALAISSAAVATVASAPFAYVEAGIVLGGAGVGLAIRRSIEMAQVRWRLAFLVAIAATLAQTLLFFGLAAGLDILVRIADALGLGLAAGDPTTFVTIAIVLAATAAAGSLVFTVGAIAAAPQVVAFVGLTHFTGGLDQAREGSTTARPVRWLTLPMALGIGIAVLSSIAGVAAVVRDGGPS
jgi:hypothetical protein